MAKCPKCERRKGKRYCPALETEICPPCCATYRLGEIACPPDCPHLASEHYQHKRRHEKAATRGKAFVAGLTRLFSADRLRQFAFMLQADLYYYMRERGRIDDATIASTLLHLKNRLGRVVIPERTPHELAGFLHRRLADPSYPRSPTFTREDAQSALETLERHIRSRHLRGHGEDSPPRYGFHDELRGYFDALDFEADLDYDPAETLVEFDGASYPRREEKRSEGGLILPP